MFPDLIKDPAKFFSYFRMTYEKFHELLDVLELKKETTRFRMAIQPEERLAVCLRYVYLIYLNKVQNALLQEYILHTIT